MGLTQIHQPSIPTLTQRFAAALSGKDSLNQKWERREPWRKSSDEAISSKIASGMWIIGWPALNGWRAEWLENARWNGSSLERSENGVWSKWTRPDAPFALAWDPIAKSWWIWWNDSWTEVDSAAPVGAEGWGKGIGAK